MQVFFSVKPPAILCPPPFKIIFFSFKKFIISTALTPFTLLIDPLKLLFLELITMLGIPYSFVNLLAIIPIIPECQFLSLTKINFLLAYYYFHI